MAVKLILFVYKFSQQSDGHGRNGMIRSVFLMKCDDQINMLAVHM